MTLDRVILDNEYRGAPSPYIEADREQAVADLAAANHFMVYGRDGKKTEGPYVLRLSIAEGRLVFDIRARDDSPWIAIGLALGPFRRLVKDYEMLVDSHIKAVEEGRESRIQAIDMGRRGLHNEASELLRTRLDGKIATDLDTARRLFTLICALHWRG